MKEVLDTNVLLRFLVGDVPAQHRLAETWFKDAETGKRSIVVIPLVVAEATYVLEKFYRKSREEIADSLEIFLSQRWLEIPERDVLLGLWSRYRKGLHFVDSFLWSWSQENDGRVLTFDKGIK